MAAYRTASRLTSSHLPNLYMGMEYVRTNNTALAHHFLRAAQELCNTDPLLYNELGVVLFRMVRHHKRGTHNVSCLTQTPGHTVDYVEETYPWAKGPCLYMSIGLYGVQMLMQVFSSHLETYVRGISLRYGHRNGMTKRRQHANERWTYVKPTMAT